MKTGLKSLLMAGLVANAALIAHAQTTTSPAAIKPMASASSPAMHPHRMDPAKMEANMSTHLADLKARLKITTPQEGAWTTFTAALKPPVRTDHPRPDPAAMDKLTAPERIDKMRAWRDQRRSEMQVQMEKREDATKVFYATLTAEQAKVFDAEHSKMMHRWNDGKGHGLHHDAPGAAVRP